MWYYPYSSLPIQSTIAPITPFPAIPHLGAPLHPEPAAPTESAKDPRRSRSRSRSPANSPKHKELKHKKPLSPAHARIRKTESNAPGNALPVSGKYFDIDTKPPDLLAKADYYRTLNQLHQALQEVDKLQALNKELIHQKTSIEERLIETHSLQVVAPPPQITAPPVSTTAAVLDNYPTYPIAQSHVVEANQIVQNTSLRPYIGVEIIEVPALGGGTDVVVKNVLHGGAAADAGIQPNDKLIKWNGIPIRSRADFGLAISEARVGDIVKLQIERGPRKRNEVVRIEVMGVDPSTEPQSPVITRTPLYSRPTSSRKTQESQGDYPEYVADAMEELQRLNMTLN